MKYSIAISKSSYRIVCAIQYAFNDAKCAHTAAKHVLFIYQFIVLVIVIVFVVVVLIFHRLFLLLFYTLSSSKYDVIPRFSYAQRIFWLLNIHPFINFFASFFFFFCIRLFPSFALDFFYLLLWFDTCFDSNRVILTTHRHNFVLTWCVFYSSSVLWQKERK